ncbi:MAG TPA: hypothetical protein VFI68_01605, partial [Anaerolineales bacterium]|nr:hypothetical protein [Anaerolineales bacterium]
MKITNREDREKRDWGLLIFIIPVGIFLMMIAGQIAIRIVPNWSVAAGMQSSLDLDSVPNQQAELVQPVLPDILTPMSWFDTYLIQNSNSGDNVIFPPFIVFEANVSPSPVGTASTSVTAAVNKTSTISGTSVSS